MGVAKATDHTVGKEILCSGKDCLSDDRHLLQHIDTGLTIHHIGKDHKVLDHADAVAGRLKPYLCVWVKAKLSQLPDAPLAECRLVQTVVQVVVAPFLVSITVVRLQRQGDAYYEGGLNQIPVVMGHTIGDNHFGPLLQRSIVKIAVLTARFIVQQKWIHLCQFVDDILVNYLKTHHTY